MWRSETTRFGEEEECIYGTEDDDALAVSDEVISEEAEVYGWEYCGKFGGDTEDEIWGDDAVAEVIVGIIIR